MSQARKYNLTEGKIFKRLIFLSLPIMATSLMQSAHNMTNMFWLSRLGEGVGERYVAAAGLAGQFVWLSMAFMFMCRIGVEIGVSQNMGKGDPEAAKSYAQNGFFLALTIGVTYTAIVIIFRSLLLQFFDIQDDYVRNIAQNYMAIIALSLPFTFGHFVITGVYNGFGNTKLPFYINSGALLLNIVLSPILIFGFDLGIYGAGISMVTAAVFNFSVKIWAMTKYKNRPFEKYTVFVKVAGDKVKQILKWGVPVAMESALFTMLFMLVSRLIAGYDHLAVAAHSVGMQIESLSFMIGGGFASALTAFVGQNYGARKWTRVRDTYKVAFRFMAGYGLFISCLLFFLAQPLVSIFLNDPRSLEIATAYLRIIALAQFLFCLENVARGGFRGRGLTIKPTIVSISSNIFRVIICYVLFEVMGIEGIWWGIAAAMTMSSVWMLVWHIVNMRKQPKVDEPPRELEAA